MNTTTMWKQAEIVLGLAVVSALASVGMSVVSAQSKRSECDGVELFGICDPYVPGVQIKLPGDDHRPIFIAEVLQGGPADRAGICPGDQIIGVNGLDFRQTTAERLFQELVAKSPKSLILKVRRTNREMEFRMGRIRESTVARMSKQEDSGWLAFKKGCPQSDAPPPASLKVPGMKDYTPQKQSK